MPARRKNRHGLRLRAGALARALLAFGLRAAKRPCPPPADLARSALFSRLGVSRRRKKHVLIWLSSGFSPLLFIDSRGFPTALNLSATEAKKGNPLLHVAFCGLLLGLRSELDLEKPPHLQCWIQAERFFGPSECPVSNERNLQGVLTLR